MAGLNGNDGAAAEAAAGEANSDAWREHMASVSDLAFETDREGRFVFVAPDPALGWRGESLIAQPAERLLLGEKHANGLNPFRPLAPVRAGRAWLRRADGSAACLHFAAAPLRDQSGAVAGARGIAFDVTEDERGRSAAAVGLRRLELFDDLLWRLRQEVLASDMVVAALSGLAAALGADGAGIVAPPGRRRRDTAECVRYHAGVDPALLLAPIGGMIARAATAPLAAQAEGWEVLAVPCLTRLRPPEVLLFWRSPGRGAWGTADCDLATAGSGILRLVLEHDAIQRELAAHSRNDPLTGLLNRRAFVEELARRIERLEREDLPGTLLLLDLDDFAKLNDRAGFDAGDAALCELAGLLRATFRPADLLCRLGNDEFAVWLDGADDFAAAERAEALRLRGQEFAAALADGSALSFSIGIATRWCGSGEEVDALMWRVDGSLQEAKQHARGSWRVSRPRSY